MQSNSDPHAFKVTTNCGKKKTTTTTRGGNNSEKLWKMEHLKKGGKQFLFLFTTQPIIIQLWLFQSFCFSFSRGNFRKMDKWEMENVKWKMENEQQKKK